MYKCIKCNGSGVVPFLHIENGKCFDCNGSGKVEKVNSSISASLKRIEALKSSLIQLESKHTQLEKEYMEFFNYLVELSNSQRVSKELTRKQNTLAINLQNVEKTIENHKQGIENELKLIEL
ncbi:hypothetical protein [Aquibacillus saliphilus]|uniref:hypothetical protein n=1 Tax=Aquibacillus saliphilus TaxID=1909422 RepID=UPI001CF08CCB|nr:hypothetical protein [Aquibacillus saliphilus]